MPTFPHYEASGKDFYFNQEYLQFLMPPEGRLQGFFDDICGIWEVRELNSFNFPTKS